MYEFSIVMRSDLTPLEIKKRIQTMTREAILIAQNVQNVKAVDYITVFDHAIRFLNQNREKIANQTLLKIILRIEDQQVSGFNWLWIGILKKTGVFGRNTEILHGEAIKLWHG